MQAEHHPPYPDFSRVEIENRWERARALMQRDGIDALFLSSEGNYRYLSGHATQSWLLKARPLFMVLPRDGDPVLVVASSEASGARNTSYVGDVRVFRTLVQPGIDELVQAFTDKDLLRGVIGAELGVAQRLGLPYLDFDTLKSRVPRGRFVDATDLLWTMRRIKSETEIAYLKDAARMVNETVLDLMQAVRSGWTERQVYQYVATGVMSRGADRPGYMPVNADARTPDSLTGGPTDRSLQPGHAVYLGAGCVYRGYWSDLVRCFAVGRVTDHQRRMYGVARRAMDRCLEVMRPGVAVSDVMRASLAVFDAAGLGEHVSRSGRIGLGTGLDLSEPPSINLEDTSVLEPGMVLYIEPNCQTDEGNFMVEETVVVTDDGVEMISTRAPAEMPVVE